MTLFNLLRRHLSFQEIDPLGAGLAEEIAAEQAESEAITLEDYPDGEALVNQWNHVAEEVESDPT